MKDGIKTKGMEDRMGSKINSEFQKKKLEKMREKQVSRTGKYLPPFRFGKCNESQEG